MLVLAMVVLLPCTGPHSILPGSCSHLHGVLDTGDTSRIGYVCYLGIFELELEFEFDIGNGADIKTPRISVSACPIMVKLHHGGLHRPLETLRLLVGCCRLLLS